MLKKLYFNILKSTTTKNEKMLVLKILNIKKTALLQIIFSHFLFSNENILSQARILSIWSSIIMIFCYICNKIITLPANFLTIKT